MLIPLCIQKGLQHLAQISPNEDIEIRGLSDVNVMLDLLEDRVVGLKQPLEVSLRNDCGHLAAA